MIQDKLLEYAKLKEKFNDCENSAEYEEKLKELLKELEI